MNKSAHGYDTAVWKGKVCMRKLIKNLMGNKLLTYVYILVFGLLFIWAMDYFRSTSGNWIILKTKDFMGGVSYYEKDLKKNETDNHYQVRIKTVYNGEGRDFFINFINNFIPLPSDIDLKDFSYVINADELNCATNQYKLLSTTLYDNRDQVLYTTTYTTQDWKDIPPRSDLRELMGKICK